MGGKRTYTKLEITYNSFKSLFTQTLNLKGLF